MNTVIPKKIGPGAHLRVIAPSRNANIVFQDGIEHAKKRLEDIGFKISFGAHIYDTGRHNNSPIQSRRDDLHEAFSDKSVDGILTMIGGYNSNQLLGGINFEIIRNNPKVFCGFSDITVLQNSIYSQTGLVTYSGPHFSSWGMQSGFEYTAQYFKKCLIDSCDFNIDPSEEWSDDTWFLDQTNRNFYKNDGHWIINEGNAKGNIIGGNLSSLALLFGTRYMPSLENSIVLIEDTSDVSPARFDSLLQSLILQNGFGRVSGLVIGRFQVKSEMKKDFLAEIVHEKKELNNIPVLANVDFGHTTPIITFPIGGILNLELGSSTIRVKIHNSPNENQF